MEITPPGHSLMKLPEQKQQEVLREDLLAVLGHELKTPLSTIKLYMQMVEHMVKNTNTRAAILLHKADNQVTEMTAMIDSILDMSLISCGKATLQKGHFDMRDLIREVIANQFHHVNTHKLTTKIEGSLLVFADKGKIKRVVHNLLSNAIKYSPERSEISISGEWNMDKVQVSVKDMGIGINPADREKLFNMFYRVESDEVNNKKGYGIGLYIVKEIIRQHRGKVWVESMEGSGSVFHFSLPIK